MVFINLTITTVDTAIIIFVLYLKGNQHGFFLHFAFFSSPVYIDMCGKRLKLLIKYALSYG